MKESKFKKNSCVSFTDKSAKENKKMPLEKTYIWSLGADGETYLIQHPEGEEFNEANKPIFVGFDTSVLKIGVRYLCAMEDELTEVQTAPAPVTETKAPETKGETTINPIQPKDNTPVSITLPRSVWEEMNIPSYSFCMAAGKDGIQRAMLIAQGVPEKDLDYQVEMVKLFLKGLNKIGIMQDFEQE